MIGSVLRRRGSWRVGVWWALAAAVVMLVGIVGSALGALALADSDSAQSRRALDSAAAQIASGLGLAIQREADVTTSTSAFVAMNPSVSQAEFVRWLEADGTHANYPELATVELDQIVPASQLHSYEEHAVAVRPSGQGAFTVIPPGKRPFYCLTAAGMAWGSLAVHPTAWIDACALPGTRGVLLSARDTGAAFYLALPYLNQSMLEVETPVYRIGVTLTSVAARHRAFVGWLGETILPSVVLARALRGHPGTALTVSYRAAGYRAAFSYGDAAANAGHVTVALAGDWTAHVSGPVAIASVFGETDALGLLAGGSVLSLLLGTLLYVLASGRARARRLVSQRTGQLEHLAMHDALTGLPNRVLALDRAEQLLARARRTGEPVAALYLDVDGFKHINDTFGHAAGDRFLEQFAGRLRDVLREGDTAARLAGDEFLVLLDCQTLDVGPELVAERLLEVLRKPYDLGEPVVGQLIMGASIGVAYGRQASPERLLADADVALYAAKAAGRNRYAVFESSMQTASRERLSLEFDLADALENGQLFLVYQPIIELTSERIVAVEALLRWRHPTRGVVEPDTFIPIAERNEQILEIGRWVLREACRQVAAWQAAGRHLGLSVNVSARQLDNDDLIDDLSEALQTAGLDPSALTLEITETAVIRDPQAAAQRVGAVKALGVQVAIDDFVTGYSSLDCLSELPIDVLKIDRSLINAIGNSSGSAAVIHTLIQLGKTVALRTLAEGI
ncbi:MAG: EAL domain-containing protein [Solirubrobacteraceae bacterium]